MPVYNYEKVNQIANSFAPLNLHLLFEVSETLMYFVSSENPKNLIKIENEGTTAEIIETRTNKNIARAWHDRDNELIYFVDCDYDDTTSYIWSISTDGNDTVTEITNQSGNVFDIWIHNSKLYYDYFGTDWATESRTEDPDADGAPLEWTDVPASPTTHYTSIDDGDTPDTDEYVWDNTNGNIDTFTIPGGYDSALSAYGYYTEDASAQVYKIVIPVYACWGIVIVDGDLTGMTPQSLDFNGLEGWVWKYAIFDGLSLSGAQVDALEITIENDTSLALLADNYVGSNKYRICRGPSDNWFLTTGSHIYQYDTDWEYVTMYSTPWGMDGEVDDICWDGTYFYITQSSSWVVKRYNSNWTWSATLGPGIECVGICWDGTSFWISTGFDDTVYEYIGTIAHPADSSTSLPDAFAITWDDVEGVFWAICPDGSPWGFYIRKYNSSWVLQASYHDIPNNTDTIGTGIFADDGDIYVKSSFRNYVSHYREGEMKIASLYLDVKFYGNWEDQFYIKNYTDTEINSEGMGIGTGREYKASQIINDGVDFWFLWKWSNENTELWLYDFSAATFIEMKDCGSGTELPLTKQSGITYDGTDVIGFILGEGTPQESTIVAVAGSSITTGEYINYSAIETDVNGESIEKEYYIWFNVSGGGGDPDPDDKTEIEVAIDVGDSAQDVSDTIESVLNAITIISCDNAGGTTCTLTNHYNGSVTEIEDIDTGMTCATLTEGVANIYYYYTYEIDEDSITQGGEYSVALMQNRNTDPSNIVPFNLEKGYDLDITKKHVYQIDRGGIHLWKIGDITAQNAYSFLNAVTDSYVFESILDESTCAYSWDDEDHGARPAGWTTSTYWARIITEYLWQYKVLRLEKNGAPRAWQYTPGPDPTSGTIEFWMCLDDIDWDTNGCYFSVDAPGFAFSLRTDSIQKEWSVYDGAVQVKLGRDLFTLGEWHHIRFDFEFSTDSYQGLAEDTYMLSIDEVEYGPYDCYGSPSAINKVDIWNSNTLGNLYINAIGYTWVGDYQRGDNKLQQAVWKLQDFSSYILDMEIYHTERDYATATLIYRKDKYFLTEGMFVQIIGDITYHNGTESITEEGVRFEGYALKPEDWDSNAVFFKIVDLINPAQYDLDLSFVGALSGTSVEYIESLDDIFTYITPGIYDGGIDPLGTINQKSEKKVRIFISQLAIGENFTWRIRPSGELDYTDSTYDTEINYDQDTPIWDVEISEKIIVANRIVVKGGYVDGAQIISDPANSVASQQIHGIIEAEIPIAWITDQTLADNYAEAILAIFSIIYFEVSFKVKDETNGMLIPGDEITLEYTPKDIVSGQYKINQVIMDDKNGIAEYIVSSILRWDIEELTEQMQEELSDQISQVADGQGVARYR